MNKKKSILAKCIAATIEAKSPYSDAEKHDEVRIDCFSQSEADLQRKACVPPKPDNYRELLKVEDNRINIFFLQWPLL